MPRAAPPSLRPAASGEAAAGDAAAARQQLLPAVAALERYEAAAAPPAAAVEGLDAAAVAAALDGVDARVRDEQWLDAAIELRALDAACERLPRNHPAAAAMAAAAPVARALAAARVCTRARPRDWVGAPRARLGGRLGVCYGDARRVDLPQARRERAALAQDRRRDARRRMPRGATAHTGRPPAPHARPPARPPARARARAPHPSAPVSQCVSFWREADLFDRWFPMCSRSRVLKQMGRCEMLAWMELSPTGPIGRRDAVLHGYGVDALDDGFMMILGRSVEQSEWADLRFPVAGGFGAARMLVHGLQVLIQPLGPDAVRCVFLSCLDLQMPVPPPVLQLATQTVVGMIHHQLEKEARRIHSAAAASDHAARMERDAHIYWGWMKPRVDATLRELAGGGDARRRRGDTK